MTNETKLNGDTEESLALLLRGEANDELKACVPTEEEERRGTCGCKRQQGLLH